MHAIDPNLTSAVVAVSATMLMVQSGVAKKMLSWRPAERRARRIERERRWRR
jgi:DNA-binding IclR family transcriptional regulator